MHFEQWILFCQKLILATNEQHTRWDRTQDLASVWMENFLFVDLSLTVTMIHFVVLNILAFVICPSNIIYQSCPSGCQILYRPLIGVSIPRTHASSEFLGVIKKLTDRALFTEVHCHWQMDCSKYTLFQKKRNFNLSVFPGAPGSLTLT